MKKLKLQVQVSVNGYIAGPNSEMDWLTWTSDDDFVKYVTELHDSIGTMVLGRKLAEGFIPYWTSIVANPEDSQYSFARIMVDTPKFVFTKTLDKSIWENTELAKGDLTTEVNQIKKQGEGDIIAYGGSAFVSSLVKENLIDEYHLFVNPAALGKGLPIFNELENVLKLKLEKATPLNCGIVILCYTPA
jgi:dihydrofolate reductase